MMPHHEAHAHQQGRGAKSAEHPMPSLVNADRVIDELYGSNPNQKIPLSKILDAEAKASVAPDVITYFRRIPEKDYTRQELIDALNSCVKERHREQAVGLFGTSHAAQQAKHETMKKRA